MRSDAALLGVLPPPPSASPAASIGTCSTREGVRGYSRFQRPLYLSRHDHLIGVQCALIGGLQLVPLLRVVVQLLVHREHKSNFRSCVATLTFMAFLI